jgi:hypothetical protein
MFCFLKDVFVCCWLKDLVVGWEEDRFLPRFSGGGAIKDALLRAVFLCKKFIKLISCAFTSNKLLIGVLAQQYLILNPKYTSY